MRHIGGYFVARLCTSRLSDLEANRPRILGRAKPIRTHNVLYLLALLVFVPSIVFAQADTGTISGTVRDTSGAVVPDATVTARNTATGVQRAAQTGPDGAYTLPGLAPALYDITVTKAGFADYKVQTPVTVGGHATLDVPLSVSQVSTTVEVVAVAGGAAEINTQTAEISQIVTPQQVLNLPSLTRNPYDFVALAGNVSGGDRTSGANPQTGGSSQNGYDRGVGFSINGQRESGTEVLLDGVENTNIFDTTVALIIPQDAVQEFRVITNNFDAQYGRASGGVIDLVTKSGSNAFHGDAWEFNRLSAYTANTFDNNARGRNPDGTLKAPKGQYTRNQFGWDVGGPIKKDKLFFYESTEFVRVRSSASVLTYVPTPQLLALTPANVQAFFNAYGQNNFTFLSTVPKSGVNFTTPADCAKAGAAANCGAFNAAVPAGTPVFGLVNFSAPADAGGDEPQNTYELVARADYNLTSSTQLFFRFGRESLAEPPGSAANSPYSQYDVGQSIYNNSFLLSVNHTFSPNILSSTKLSFFRDAVANQYTTALQTTPTLFPYSGATVAGVPLNFPGFYPSTPSLGGLPYGGPQNSLQVGEDLSWTKGKHVMRYGGQFNYTQLNRGYGAYAQATEQVGKSQPSSLDNLMTGMLSSFQVAVDPQGKFPCQSLSFPDNKTLIVTPACTLTLPASPPSFNRSYRYNDWALYAEDNFRVTPRLTINYGLRYEHYGVQHNNDPKLDSNFYFGPGANFYQQVRSGSIQTVPNSPIGELWKPRWGTAGPRVGFAYDVFGDGKTSFRGGYGITYERNFGNVTFNMIQNPPAYAKPNITSTPITISNFGPFAGSSGSVPLPPVSPRHVSQNIQVAQTQFWSVAVERQLGSKSVVALEYNGAHGVHLYDIKNINPLGGGQVYLGDLFDGTHYTRPNQQFVSINNRGSDGFSHYNALNLRFQTQELGKTGLLLSSNYTYAHSLDPLSSTFSESSSGSNGVGNLGYLDPRNVWLDYGNSDFDIRHRFVLSMIWSEPFLKGSKGLTKEVASGWSLAPIFTARTGVPFSFSDSTQSLGAGIDGSGIPRYAPTGPISSIHVDSGTPIGANNFNLLSLPSPNSFTGLLGISDFGPYPANMTSRNQFYGPGAWSFDLALSKNFLLTERFSLEFRAEGFDIFNHIDMFVNGYNNDVANFNGAILVEGKKGGLGQFANGGGANHDERRFGQFALRLHF
jgi:outer membrane receptor protein involved in Fe transport